jgi:hypothetical protein
VKTLATITTHALWWAIVAAITLAMDGTAQWFAGGFLIVAGVVGCVSNIRARHAAGRVAGVAPAAASSQSAPPAPAAPAPVVAPVTALQPSASPEAPPEQPVQAPDEPQDDPTPWTLSLLVDADEQSGVLRLSLRIGGPRTPICATVHLEVFDERGESRLSTVRRFVRPEPQMDLNLGALTLPNRVSADEAACWDWDVVLHEGDEELVRRRGPLAGAGDLNGEAELGAPDLVPAPPTVSPPDLATLLALLAAGVREYVALDQCPIDRTAARLLPEHVQRSDSALPIGWRDGQLLVAIANASALSRLGDFQVITGCEIEMIGASSDALVRAIDRLAAEAA